MEEEEAEVEEEEAELEAVVGEEGYCVSGCGAGEELEVVEGG